jgi:homocysteine S-methyltransferase
LRRPWIIDGGLATGLEEAGHALDRTLWSAGTFLANPQAVEDLHRAYLDAGAEILISASYQMSFAGLGRAGLDRDAAARAMRDTVRVARRAAERAGAFAIVAASVGPYGATLADGSEYHGQHGLDRAALAEFHRERLEVLLSAGADLLAIETIPALDEAVALAGLLASHRAARAWMSFTCRDGRHLRDGTRLADAVRAVAGSAQIVALGVNCTDPVHVISLMEEIRKGSTKPIVVYPNSGEIWDARARRWTGETDEEDFLALARAWVEREAWAVGGCCRVGPRLIARLARLAGRAV